MVTLPLGELAQHTVRVLCPLRASCSPSPALLPALVFASPRPSRPRFGHCSTTSSKGMGLWRNRSRSAKNGSTQSLPANWPGRSDGRYNCATTSATRTSPRNEVRACARAAVLRAYYQWHAAPLRSSMLRYYVSSLLRYYAVVCYATTQ